MRVLGVALFAAGLICGVSPLTISAAASVPTAISGLAGSVLMPHRAVYDLKLERSNESSGIDNVTGRMVYEFNGSSCEGYTTNFRFVTRIEAEDQERITDQQAATFESADGNAFEFVNKTFVDKELAKEVRGNAKVDKQALDVELSKPEAVKLSLAKSQFPTRHMMELLGKAEAGETFYQTSIYDGSDEADKVMTTTAVIGKPRQMPADEETKVMGDIANQPSWQVTVAYFDDENEEGLPIYRTDFKLYRNGVTRDLNMDYGDFAMKGTLVKLDMLPIAKNVTDCAAQ